MKRFTGGVMILTAIFLLASCESEGPDETVVTADLVINEFMASNDSHDVDGSGTFPDWIEIHNLTDSDIDLGGHYITDQPHESISEWHWISTGSTLTVVPAQGWLVLYADDSGQGPLHLGFKLSSAGESLGLAAPGGTILQTLTFGQQLSDVSYGVPAGGSESMVYLAAATPGAANSVAAGNFPPTVDSWSKDPRRPAPLQDVTVLADVSDDRGILSVVLNYQVDGGQWQDLAMAPIDEIGVTYSAQIPGQAADSVVGFYILVTDSDLESTTEPAAAPDELHSFLFEDQLPFVLYINEFMADNETTLAADGQYEDPADAYVDWIEIYNPGSEAIDIGGFFLTDDLNQNQLWQIPTSAPDSTTIAAGGFLILYADSDPERGVRHLDFKLSSGGEDIGLFADDGQGNILRADSTIYDGSDTDVSEGRQEDGHEHWQSFEVPTPGSSNSAR